MTDHGNGREDERIPTRRTDGQTDTVQLLVADAGNRTAVRELLTGRYEIVTEQSVREADLYLVDDRSLPRFESELREQVDRSHPVFCPVVLVRHENPRVQISLPDPNDGESPMLVDDVVDAPLERGLVYRRLDSLLVRRDQSAELKRHVSELEERERELTSQNDRLERFASVVSHDLQNPLNVIGGYADLVVETGNPEHAENIREAVERMETILDDLLVLARQGTDLGEVEPVDLEALAERAADSVDTKTATIAVGDLGTVEVDPGRLRQVFENLLRNAVEHGSTSNRLQDDDSVEHVGEDVTLRVEAIDSGFAVEDDGPGIPEAKREQVFEQGYTGGDGTGLGLSIVQTVVDAHGWDVAVTEGSDGGARFEVTGVEWVEE